MLDLHCALRSALPILTTRGGKLLAGIHQSAAEHGNDPGRSELRTETDIPFYGLQAACCYATLVVLPKSSLPPTGGALSQSDHDHRTWGTSSEHESANGPE